MPDFISAGYLPVLAIVFSSIAIPLCISGGPYFTYSAFSPSSPTHFQFSCFWMPFRFIRLCKEFSFRRVL